MPQQRHYSIHIANQYTGVDTHYDAHSLTECAAVINQHYGLHHMITRNGVVNMLARGVERSPKRFSAIHIDKNPY